MNGESSSQDRTGGTSWRLALVSSSALDGDHGGGHRPNAFGESPADAPGGNAPLDQQDRISVVVCDSLPVFAQGLARLLEEEAPNLLVAGVEVSLVRAMSVIRDVRPAVAVIGLRAADADELDAVCEICATCPDTRVVVLLPDAGVTGVWDTLAGSGVTGYALKERDAAEIADVVSLVARGHLVMPAAVGLPRERRADPHSLDDVERQILKGVACSETNRHLAARLHISERTVCRRLEGIYEKLELSDRLQAAVYAAMHGFVSERDVLPRASLNA